MKDTNDSIIFEHREEVTDTIEILRQWMREHPTDRRCETARKMVALADTIEMCW